MMGFLFGLAGRISRRGFAIFFVVTAALGFAARLLDEHQFPGAPPGTGFWSRLSGALLLWPSLAVGVKRFHDFGWSGWIWFLASIVSLVGYYYYQSGSWDSLESLEMFLDDLWLRLMETGEWSLETIVGGLTVGLVGLGTTMACLFIPGQKGWNDYAADPLIPLSEQKRPKGYR